MRLRLTLLALLGLACVAPVASVSAQGNDPVKRKQLYTEATQIIHEEKPALELFQEVIVYGSVPIASPRMSEALYLDTSAVLRALIETGTTPEVEQRIRRAAILVTSRLSTVETTRALTRLRLSSAVPEPRLADAERQIASLWARCELWELTAAVCDLACHVAPGKSLRALDALHLATFVLARRRIETLRMVTVDERLGEAAEVSSFD